MDRRHGWAPHALAGTLTLVVLAPLAAPGYVLSYDMVFVPRQAPHWNLVAPAAGLPRAVPLDAVVSVLNLAAPGWLLQRIALAGLVYAAALGAGRLVPAERLSTRIVAAVAYAWAPFMAERLLLGQWALLVAYAALPWLVRAAIALRAGRPGALPRLILPAAACAITPTGGLIAVATVAVLTAGRGRAALRRRGLAVGAVFALNAPWLVTAATTRASGTSDPAGVAAFAARGENWSGPLGALAGTGGIWNAETTPASRGSVLVPLVTAALVILAAFGFRSLRQRWPAGAATHLAGLAGGAFALALLGTVPGTANAVEWIVGRVPGAGLLRDGQKFVMPYAVLLAMCVALGAERLAARLAPARARVVLVAAVAVPIALMPDLAFGAAGQLRPVQYPVDWERVRALVAAEKGPLIALPFSEYRAYGWNRNRTVIDPSPRYFPVDVALDDTLYVGPIVVEGEDRRAAEVRALLASGQPVARAGPRWVLVERDAGGTIPAGALTGLTIVYRGQTLDLYANPAWTTGPSPDLMVRTVVLAAYGVAAGLAFAASLRLRPGFTPW